MKTRAHVIELTVQDLALDLLYYDRKEDPELPRGEIQEAIKNTELTAEDIVGWFRESLLKQLS